MFSDFSHVQVSATLWTVTCQAPLSMGFSSKTTRVGRHPLLQGPSWPRDWTRVSCGSCIAGGFFTTEALGKLKEVYMCLGKIFSAFIFRWWNNIFLCMHLWICIYVCIWVCVFAKKNSVNVYNIMLTITSEVFKLRTCWERCVLFTLFYTLWLIWNAGDLGLIPGLRRSTGEGKGYPLQYSGLKKSMDRRVHGVTKSQTR